MKTSLSEVIDCLSIQVKDAGTQLREAHSVSLIYFNEGSYHYSVQEEQHQHFVKIEISEHHDLLSTTCSCPKGSDGLCVHQAACLLDLHQHLFPSEPETEEEETFTEIPSHSNLFESLQDMEVDQLLDMLSDYMIEHPELADFIEDYIQQSDEDEQPLFLN